MEPATTATTAPPGIAGLSFDIPDVKVIDPPRRMCGAACFGERKSGYQHHVDEVTR